MNIVHLDYDNPHHPKISGGGAIRNREIYLRFSEKHTIDVVTSYFPSSDNMIRDVNITYHRMSSSYRRCMNRFDYSFGNIKKGVVKNADIIIDDFTPFSPTFRYYFYTSWRYTHKRRDEFLINLINAHELKGLKVKHVRVFPEMRFGLRNRDGFVFHDLAFPITLVFRNFFVGLIGNDPDQFVFLFTIDKFNKRIL